MPVEKLFGPLLSGLVAFAVLSLVPHCHAETSALESSSFTSKDPVEECAANGEGCTCMPGDGWEVVENLCVPVAQGQCAGGCEWGYQRPSGLTVVVDQVGCIKVNGQCKCEPSSHKLANKIVFNGCNVAGPGGGCTGTCVTKKTVGKMVLVGEGLCE